MCSDVKEKVGAKSNGKLPHLIIPVKTAALVPEFAVENAPSAQLQPRFLPCSEGPALEQNTLMMMMMMMMMMMIL